MKMFCSVKEVLPVEKITRTAGPLPTHIIAVGTITVPTHQKLFSQALLLDLTLYQNLFKEVTRSPGGAKLVAFYQVCGVLNLSQNKYWSQMETKKMSCLSCCPPNFHWGKISI